MENINQHKNDLTHKEIINIFKILIKKGWEISEIERAKDLAIANSQDEDFILEIYKITEIWNTLHDIKWIKNQIAISDMLLELRIKYSNICINILTKRIKQRATYIPSDFYLWIQRWLWNNVYELYEKFSEVMKEKTVSYKDLEIIRNKLSEIINNHEINKISREQNILLKEVYNEIYDVMWDYKKEYDFTEILPIFDNLIIAIAEKRSIKPLD